MGLWHVLREGYRKGKAMEQDIWENEQKREMGSALHDLIESKWSGEDQVSKRSTDEHSYSNEGTVRKWIESTRSSVPVYQDAGTQTDFPRSPSRERPGLSLSSKGASGYGRDRWGSPYRSEGSYRQPQSRSSQDSGTRNMLTMPPSCGPPPGPLSSGAFLSSTQSSPNTRLGRDSPMGGLSGHSNGSVTNSTVRSSAARSPTGIGHSTKRHQFFQSPEVILEWDSHTGTMTETWMGPGGSREVTAEDKELYAQLKMIANTRANERPDDCHYVGVSQNADGLIRTELSYGTPHEFGRMLMSYDPNKHREHWTSAGCSTQDSGILGSHLRSYIHRKQGGDTAAASGYSAEFRSNHDPSFRDVCVKARDGTVVDRYPAGKPQYDIPSIS